MAGMTFLLTSTRFIWKVQSLLIWWEWFVWHWCNLTAKESGLECACVNSDDFTVLLSGGVDAIEWACVLCGCGIQNDWVEWQICIKFCVKLEHSSMETIWIIQKPAALGNWWLADSPWQCTRLCIMSYEQFFGETSNHSGDSAPL